MLVNLRFKFLLFYRWRVTILKNNQNKTKIVKYSRTKNLVEFFFFHHNDSCKTATYCVDTFASIFSISCNFKQRKSNWEQEPRESEIPISANPPVLFFYSRILLINPWKWGILFWKVIYLRAWASDRAHKRKYEAVWLTEPKTYSIVWMPWWMNTSLMCSASSSPGLTACDTLFELAWPSTSPFSPVTWFVLLY